MSFDRRKAFLSLRRDELVVLCDELPSLLWNLSERDVLRARWKAASARDQAAFDAYIAKGKEVDKAFDMAQRKKSTASHTLYLKARSEQQALFVAHERAEAASKRLFDALMACMRRDV